MSAIYTLENTVREYAWGDTRNIAGILGLSNPESRPMAELWMGAHPSAPSRLQANGSEYRLDSWIQENPDKALGPELHSRYGRLPYLFKLLSAAQALSIQAHPDKHQAEEGFKKENEAGIPQDSPARNYRDDNHKPEILMALTTFTAMIGFRPLKDIVGNLNEVIHDEQAFAMLKSALVKSDSEPSIALLLQQLLGLNSEAKTQLVEKACRIAGQNDCSWPHLVRRWIPVLAQQYPGDIGALFPLILHLVEIQPGEALYQPARSLHAYLSGFGVELMANSDNVLRGGLSSKHIDVPELMRILNFSPSPPELLQASPVDSEGLRRFRIPAKEFALVLYDSSESSRAKLTPGAGPRIVLVLHGTLNLSNGIQTVQLNKGMSAFIPWDSPETIIEGSGRAVIAEVGK